MVRHLLRSLGYDIYKFPPIFHPLGRRKNILESYAIDTVLDVGANSGQFAQQLRGEYIRYKKKIISFEPLSSAFELLKTNSKNDKDWEIFNFALGDKEAEVPINIAGNSYSSSLLDMLPAHEKAAPASKNIGKEIIEVKTLDSIFNKICKPNDKIYLKIDTQGFEDKVIKGAKKSIEHIDIVHVEMSFVPLYKDAPLFNEIYTLLSELEFFPIAIENEFVSPESRELLQVDGIFKKVK